MGIDLQLPKRNEPVNMKFKIPADVAEEFDLYVEAAQDGHEDEIDRDMVLQAILQKTLKKDRSFRSWLKARRKNGRNGGNGKAAAKGNLDMDGPSLRSGVVS